MHKYLNIILCIPYISLALPKLLYYYIYMKKMSVEDSFLYSHSLFGGLSEDELASVKEFLIEEHYAPGELILTENRPNSKIFFIIEGKVEIFKHSHTEMNQEFEPDECHQINHNHDAEDYEIAISELLAGDTFGEMELIDVQPCAASVRAVTDTRLLSLNNRDLYTLSKEHLKTFTMIVMNLAREISRRLREADSRLTMVLYEHNHNTTT